MLVLDRDRAFDGSKSGGASNKANDTSSGPSSSGANGDRPSGHRVIGVVLAQAMFNSLLPTSMPSGALKPWIMQKTLPPASHAFECPSLPGALWATGNSFVCSIWPAHHMFDTLGIKEYNSNRARRKASKRKCNPRRRESCALLLGLFLCFLANDCLI